MNKPKRLLTIEFKPNFVQTDENGQIETLFFQDDHGTEISLNYNPNADYSKGILVTIEEAKYKVYKGKMIGSSACELIVSIASKTEIRESEKEIKSEAIKPAEVNIETLSEEEENDVELTILFKMSIFKNSTDKDTNQEVRIVRYNDSSGNNFYLTENEYEMLFGKKYFNKFIALTMSLEDIKRDFERTKLRYPESTRANISWKSVRTAKELSSSEYDWTLLEEILEGQRVGDPRYNTTSIFNLYQEIFRSREEERKRREAELEFNAPIVAPVNTTNPQIQKPTLEPKVDGRRAGAQRRVEKMRQDQEMKNMLERRVIELENIIKNLEANLQGRERELAHLRSEYSATRANYEKLRRIFDGEDDSYTAVIYPIS